MPTDIRQLTKAGTQFYPQTHIAAVVGYQGDNVVDDEPTPGSLNLPTSGSVYKKEEETRNIVEGYIPMTPLAVVEGKFINASGEEATNSSLCYYKYAVDERLGYFLSEVIVGKNLTIWLASFFDEEYNYISDSHDIHVSIDSEESQTVVKHNVFIKAPLNAKYLYVNVQSSKRDSLLVSSFPDTNNDISGTLALKAFGLDKTIVYNNKYFARSNGVKPIQSCVLAKYAVTPNTRYAFKIDVPETTLNMYFISYLDENGDYTTGSPSLRINSGEAVTIDTEIETSSTCRYVYVNIPKVAIDSVVFGYSDLSEKKEENNSILPAYISQIPYEVTEGKYVGLPASGETAPEEKTLASMKYSKYMLEQNKKYVANYTIGARTTVYMLYYVDENGDYIARALNNSTGNIKSGSLILEIPANAESVYINEGVSGGSTITLNEVSTTDRTEEILTSLRVNGICRLGAGDYYINALNMPDNTTLVGDGKNTRLILSGTSDGYAIRVGARCTISDLQIDGNANLEYKGEENLSVDEIHMDGNRHGILLLGDGENPKWAGSVITRCEITNFNGGGITCDNTGYGTYSSLTVSDCWIRHCCVGINVAYFSEFNKFVNIGCYDCRYGCINNGGNNSFDTCGFNHNQIGFYINENAGKCIRYDGTVINGKNAGHGVLANCILDHNGKDNSDVGYAIVVIGVSQGYQFANLSIHYGKLYFEGSNNISLANGKLGQNTGWEIRNMVTPIVISSFVGVATSYTPFAVYINDQLITDFDADGNGGYTYMYNCFRYRTKATPQYLMSL